MLRIFPIVGALLVLAACSGSPARMAYQSSEAVYSFIKQDNRGLCNHYQNAIRHYSTGSEETAKKYFDALLKVAAEQNTNVFECDTKFGKYFYDSEKHFAAKGFFESCRVDFALAPLLRINQARSLQELADQSHTTDLKEIASETYERLNSCQNNYGMYSGLDGGLAALTSELLQDEKALLLAAYNGRISESDLLSGFQSLNVKLASYFQHDYMLLRGRIAADRASAQANRAALNEQNQKLLESTNSAYQNMTDSLKDNSNSLKCKPDPAWELLGETNMICK